MAGTKTGELPAKAAPAARGGPTDEERALRTARLAEQDHQAAGDGGDQQASEPGPDHQALEVRVNAADVKAAAAAVEAAGELDAKVQRLGRLTRFPRHVRTAHSRLVDAEAADRLADLLVQAETAIDAGVPVTPALFGDFEAALARWKTERGFEEPDELDTGVA